METRERILNAATDVFVEKGIAGARMQEIADRADVNKAMLHYYFSSKDKLYEAALSETFAGLFEQVRKAIGDPGLTASQRIGAFLGMYIDMLAENPAVPALILQDLAAGGERVKRILVAAQERASFFQLSPPKEAIRQGIDEGVFRDVDVDQTLISIMGMSVFFFIARPILGDALGVDTDLTSEVVEARKRNVKDLLLNGLLSDSAKRGGLEK